MNAITVYKILDDFRVWVRFSDGYECTIHLKPLLNKGIGKELLDITAFQKVSIESGGGLAWENGFDICPNTLRELASHEARVA